MLTRTLGPEGDGLGSPTLIGEGNECQRECWDPKNVGCCDIPHRLGRMKHYVEGRENFSLVSAL